MRTYGRYALVYLLKGSGRMRIAGRPMVNVRAGDLLFVYPEIPHGYGPGPDETWNELFLVFSGPVFDLWRKQGLMDPEHPVRHLPRISRWLPQLESVADPRLAETPGGMLQRVCRLQKFLGDIAGRTEPAPGKVSWLEEARRKLLETPGASPREVARSVGISYEKFRKDFARGTGYPPGRYRAVRLIDQARVLITERQLSNKEVAESLGFYDEFHFSRRFHQITGQSPRDFRRLFPRGL